MNCTAQRKCKTGKEETRELNRLLHLIVKLEGKQMAREKTIKIKWMWTI